MKITVKGWQSKQRIEANRRQNRALKLPRIVETPFNGKCLALCGGSPTLADHLDEIRAFDEVWGINEVPAFLNKHGIKATMFSIDGYPLEPECYEVESAILADHCEPQLFEALKHADVRVFDATHGGCTSMCRAPRIALNLGFSRVTFFGCEGSFRDSSHAYKDVRRGTITVRCEGRNYLSQPDYFMQSELLAEYVREHPRVFSERSGGLLAAMCRTGRWQIVSTDIKGAA